MSEKRDNTMSEKIFSAAILGVGARGGDVYGRIMASMPDKFKIVSLCDLKKERISFYGEEFGVAEDARFQTEEEFFEKKRADVLIVATQDADHVRHAIKGFELGYDILLEKPITDSKKECERLLAAQKKYGGKALVCHVLRYAPAFTKAYEILESGAIGKLICIEALERVGYWHQAHSFVRGNWRSTKYTAPMILSSKSSLTDASFIIPTFTSPSPIMRYFSSPSLPILSDRFFLSERFERITEKSPSSSSVLMPYL